MPKKFLSWISLKFNVANPYAIRIKDIKFCQFCDEKFFGIEGSPLWIFQALNKNFQIHLRAKGAGGHTSRS